MTNFYDETPRPVLFHRRLIYSAENATHLSMKLSTSGTPTLPAQTCLVTLRHKTQRKKKTIRLTDPIEWHTTEFIYKGDPITACKLDFTL